MIFRLLLLGVGGGLALILGIVLANFYPSLQPERPLILKVLDLFREKTPASSPNGNSTQVSDPTNLRSQLTPAQRQQAQAQLTQLQEQLKALSDGVTTLETQLGTSHPNEAIEPRLQAVALQLQGVPDPEGNTSSAQPVVATASVFPADKLKVTLPSDALFEENNSILRSEAGLILDKIVADLRNYPASTIRIASHTDRVGDSQDNRELSFRRAKAVQQYLIRTLGKQYRWFVVGYGGTRPLSNNDTDTNRQRNRRIEIAVN
jgi:outer membrane protein OmpA-like peptidoglycan-associated protein